jgi:phosphate/phosphite/phosphonate ABC transporter binding protein
MLSPGTILQGRYRVVGPLGQGGMAAVYRVWDMRLNAPLALKEMMPQPGLDEATLAQLRRQFEQEASILANLSHPFLVDVTDYFEEGGNDYLVMKFVEGESLADCIAREGALPEDQVLAWADHLLAALDYCHGQGVIHRDIKPQNVIIRSDGHAVLVDFGLVKLWDPGDPRTRTAMRGMGTPEYAPPEQYAAQAAHTDPRSDIYGLGATLYHALTGQIPMEAGERMAALSPFLGVRDLNPRVSAQTDAAVSRAMELPVPGRFRSAAEMRAALQGDTSVQQTDPVAPVDSTVTSARRQSTKLMPGARAVGTPWRQRVPTWGWLALAGAGFSVAVLLGLGLLALITLGGGAAKVSPTQPPAGVATDRPPTTMAAAATELPTSVPTEAKLGTESNPIIMQYVPWGDTEEMVAGSEEIAAMIKDETGLVVQVNVGTDYAAIREAMGTGEVHIGWLNAFNYILANEKYGVDAGLVAVRYGSSSYSGQIIVRADSGIASLKDLKGKSMCWVDTASTSGYIIPRITLKAEGIDPDTDFSFTTEVGSHDNVVAAVYNGDCDAGATFSDARGAIEGDYSDVKEVVSVLATTTDIPNDSISFAKNFPVETRDQVVQALLDIAADEAGQEALYTVYSIDGLEKTDDLLYDGLRADLSAAGIDIETLVE